MLRLDSIKQFVIDNKSQSHLCICNANLFDGSVNNGVYGFPHAGRHHTKSFWRAISSMYNLGANDLVFLYRTKGNRPGCQEINGPFKVHALNGFPAIYYDPSSPDLPLLINGETDCKVRFLFESFDAHVYSIADNYELIKKFEDKTIWGYRHPAVMNIGAARKKSVTSFTHKQTLALLGLFETFGADRQVLPAPIPLPNRVAYYNSLRNNQGDNRFILDDSFLIAAETRDEAYLYSYFLRGIKNPTSQLHDDLITQFSNINDAMLHPASGKSFDDLSMSALMEAVISPHLQDELDIVLFDAEDQCMLVLEFKDGTIDQQAILQTQKYMDLLSAILPGRQVFANIVGSGREPGAAVGQAFRDTIKLIKYERNSLSGLLSFTLLNDAIAQ
ncbi:MAG: hypothetical protein WCJ71_10845 [Candidatus Omnitrophota bacterium]